MAWQKGVRNTNVRGIGTFRFKGDQFKVVIKDNEGKIVLDEKFNRSALPDYPTNLEEGKEYMVYMGQNNASVQSITPTEGIFDVICTDFRRPEEGADPEPKTYEREYKGQKSSYQAFTAYLKILNDEVGDTGFGGVLLGFFLRYKVCNVDGKAGFSPDSTNPKANQYRDELIKFFELTGVGEEEMEFPTNGNILPEALRRIKLHKRQFRVVISGGYIVSIMATPIKKTPAVTQPPLPATDAAAPTVTEVGSSATAASEALNKDDW